MRQGGVSSPWGYRLKYAISARAWRQPFSLLRWVRSTMRTTNARTRSPPQQQLQVAKQHHIRRQRHAVFKLVVVRFLGGCGLAGLQSNLGLGERGP